MVASPACPCYQGWWPHVPGEGESVNFVFECGWCEEDNVLWGERTGFWGTKFELPNEWDCWNCGGTCVTHDPPWQEY